MLRVAPCGAGLATRAARVASARRGARACQPRFMAWAARAAPRGAVPQAPPVARHRDRVAALSSRAASAAAARLQPPPGGRRVSAPLRRSAPPRAAAASAAAAGLTLSLSLPAWSLLAGGALLGALALLFASALLLLLPTLRAVQAACAAVVTTCADVSLCARAVVTACDDVEGLATDVREDLTLARTGVREAVTAPLERALDTLKQTADPAAEMINNARATLVASLAALAAAVATLLVL